MIEIKLPSDGHMVRTISLPENDLAIQLSIFSEALNIYGERGEARGEVWKEFDAEDSIHHLVSKAARLRAGLRQAERVHGDFRQGVSDTMIDEAMDAINYAAFTVRHLRGETGRVG
jgi:hypothetical protein